jgi:hypothetical protein
MSTLKATYLQQASSASPNITLDASTNATVAGTLAMGSSFKRNRIINGDMRIDQRNNGAEVNPAVGGTYYVDRWLTTSTSASKFKIGQNAGSVTPPAGFTNYLGATSLSAYTVATTDAFGIQQRIEGLNTSDLAWGTANAKTVTLSFWVYSSLTGTFAGSIRNSAQDRSYVFSYTINAANTWEYKTITVAGDITGTWLTTNGLGLSVYFSIGVGSNFSTTAGSWTAGNYLSPTGATSVVGTNGATFYITGVQLEVGSVATPYERQIYSQQLQECLRYYQIYRGATTGTDIARMFTGYTYTGTQTEYPVIFPVQMRSAPTLSNSAVSSIVIVANGTSYAISALLIYQASTTAALIYTANSSLTVGFGAGLGNAAASTTAFIALNSEL